MFVLSASAVLNQTQQVLFAKKHAFLFAMPDENDKAALFEPLERMRAIVPNVLACMRASLPSNCWQRVFSAYYLPSPLGPIKPGKPKVKLEFKKNLLCIFENAKHADPEKTFNEVAKLLPYAENMHKAGLGIRESWAAASRDFPELLRARDAVNLLLGNKPTTGSVERMLRVVAAQRDAERGHLSRDVLRDIFVVDMLGPQVTEVALQELAGPYRSRISGPHPTGPASTITPKGPYLPKILKAYRVCFVGKNYKQQPKKRRDQGVARSDADVERKRRRAKMPQTEASFMRRREAELKATLELSAEDRGRKRKLSLVGGGEVPADTDKYVSEAITTVREKAAVRETRKAKHKGTPVKKQAAAHKVRWLGESCSEQAACSSQSGLRPGKTAGAAEGGVQILLASNNRHGELLLRRMFDVCTSWIRFAAAALGGGRQSIVVVPELAANGLQENPIVLLSRFCGGYLTTSDWLEQAVRQGKAPKGMSYKGLDLKKEMHIWLSPELKGWNAVFDIIQLVVQAKNSNWHLVETMAVFRGKCNKYLTDHGPRSRPSSLICALTKSETEKKALAKAEEFVGHDNMLQTLDEFLSRHSPAKGEALCPGNWAFSNPARSR